MKLITPVFRSGPPLTFYVACLSTCVNNNEKDIPLLADCKFQGARKDQIKLWTFLINEICINSNCWEPTLWELNSYGSDMILVILFFYIVDISKTSNEVSLNPFFPNQYWVLLLRGCSLKTQIYVLKTSNKLIRSVSWNFVLEEKSLKNIRENFHNECKWINVKGATDPCEWIWINIPPFQFSSRRYFSIGTKLLTSHFV